MPACHGVVQVGVGGAHHGGGFRFGGSQREGTVHVLFEIFAIAVSDVAAGSFIDEFPVATGVSGGGLFREHHAERAITEFGQHRASPPRELDVACCARGVGFRVKIGAVCGGGGECGFPNHVVCGGSHAERVVGGIAQCHDDLEGVAVDFVLHEAENRGCS